MSKNRVNSALIRRINIARLFHAIRQSPQISQQRLSAETGIDPATVSIIIGNLEAAGVVRRVADARTGRAGRPTSALSINAEAGLLVGIGVEPDTIRLTIATIDGVARGSAVVPGSRSVVLALAASRAGLAGMLRKLRAEHLPLLGVGIGLPGLVSLEGRLIFAPNLGWRDIDFAGRFARHLKVPIRAENDTKAAALAEHLFGASRDVADFIYVTGRSGIGGGLYMMGELYRGPHGLAGEIGHMKIIPGGRACACGARGCFEAYVSEQAILTQLADEGHLFADAATLRDAASAGNETVRRVLGEAGESLGLGFASMINLLAPRRIVLGGSLAILAPFLLPSAMPVLEANALTAIRERLEIVLSPLGEDAVTLGGVALALQNFLTDPPLRLGAGAITKGR
jgi:predicted NBD/HSP70 family sugar kinase